MDQKYDDLTERLLEQACWVIDILPRQVPADGAGQYFAVEQFLMTVPQLEDLYARFARLILKLNCYYDIILGSEEEWYEEPMPEHLWAKIIRCADGGYLNLLFPKEEALITLSGGDLYMTLYGSSKELLETVKQLAGAEGLFVRIAEEG